MKRALFALCVAAVLIAACKKPAPAAEQATEATVPPTAEQAVNP